MIGIPKNLKDGDLLIYKNGKFETINVNELPKTDLGGIKRDIEALTKLVKDQNKRNIDFVNKLKEAYKHE